MEHQSVLRCQIKHKESISFPPPPSSPFNALGRKSNTEREQEQEEEEEKQIANGKREACTF